MSKGFATNPKHKITLAIIGSIFVVLSLSVGFFHTQLTNVLSFWAAIFSSPDALVQVCIGALMMIPPPITTLSAYALVAIPLTLLIYGVSKAIFLVDNFVEDILSKRA